MRARFFVGGVLTFGIVAAACGSAGPTRAGGSSPQQAVVASYRQTLAGRSAAVNMALSVSGSPSLGGFGSSSGKPVSLTITATGAFDFANRKGDMTLVLPPNATRGSASSIELRLLDPYLYINYPPLMSSDGGKPWISTNLSQYQRQVGQQAGPLSGLSSGDPTQMLQALDEVSNGVSEVGPAKIGGVATTEYEGSLDLSKRSSTGSTVLSPGLAEQYGLSTIPVRVWVDDAGRARQMQLSFSIIGLQVSITIALSDFGLAVAVTPPPPDQTADGSALLNSGRLGDIFSNGITSALGV